MQLAEDEKRILEGEQGDPKRVAMRILSRLGEVNDADRMIPVASGHLVACSYQIAGEAGIEVYTRLVEQGAKSQFLPHWTPAPSTSNGGRSSELRKTTLAVRSLSLNSWRKWG